MSILVLSNMSKWSAANKLVLKLDRVNIIKFKMNNLPHCALLCWLQQEVCSGSE